MAINGRPDGQMIMTSSFVIGAILGALLMLTVAIPVCAIMNAPCPPKDCSIETEELRGRVRMQQNEIKRLEVYEQALKWGTKK